MGADVLMCYVLMRVKAGEEPASKEAKSTAC
jgi:hypothetical protein